jgi:hypothetical protein
MQGNHRLDGIFADDSDLIVKLGAAEPFSG